MENPMKRLPRRVLLPAASLALAVSSVMPANAATTAADCGLASPTPFTHAAQGELTDPAQVDWWTTEVESGVVNVELISEQLSQWQPNIKFDVFTGDCAPVCLQAVRFCTTTTTADEIIVSVWGEPNLYVLTSTPSALPTLVCVDAYAAVNSQVLVDENVCI
jgi:hypothetical protein